MSGFPPVASNVNTSSASNYASSSKGVVVGAGVTVPEDFPVGLRVLLVEDDTTALMIVRQLLRGCLYNVTSCSEAKVALNILSESRGCFDVVLSDVHMPEMDGFELLKHVLKMDLPVVMMSSDCSTNTVMRGIINGACDYLSKPLREEELQNIWQHVIRKKLNGNKELEHSRSLADNDQHKQENDDVKNASSVDEGTEGALKCQKKRSNVKEEDDDDALSTSKKPRVVWSLELHQQFVHAVDQLGIDKAVPKRILELMNVPGITRENVASHLQKYRIYLKKRSEDQQQGGSSNAFCGSLDSNVKPNSLGRYNIEALAAFNQIHPQTLAMLHAENLGRPTGSLVTTMDQPALLQSSLQAPKYIPIEHGLSFAQSLEQCQMNISKSFPQNMASVEEITKDYVAWSSNALGTLGPSSNQGGITTLHSNRSMDILKQQQQHRQLNGPQEPSSLPEHNHPITVQPSCLPSQSSVCFQTGNGSASMNHNSSNNRNAAMDYSFLSPISYNSPMNICQLSDGDFKAPGVVSAYSAPCSISPTALSCSVNADSGNLLQFQNPTMSIGAARQLLGVTPTDCGIQGSYGTKSGEVLDQGSLMNIGLNRGTCIPGQFTTEQFESQLDLNHGKIYLESNGNQVKSERSVELTDNARAGIQVLQHIPASDMSVFTN